MAAEAHNGNAHPRSIQRRWPILDSTNHKNHVEDKRANACDSSHPYRIPRISYLAHTTGSISSSTRFSTGTGTYQSGTIHADYHAGVQDEFNFQTAEGPSLIKLCLIDGAESVEEKHPRCGQGP